MPFWIVSGPSCAGKSTFMESPRCAEITGLEKRSRVVFPGEIEAGGWPVGEQWLLHYNILRPYDELRLSKKFAGVPARCFPPSFLWKRFRAEWSYDLDPAWRAVRSGKERPSGAVVLAASRGTLVSRASKRRMIEPGKDAPRFNEYPSRRWAGIIGAVDMTAVYGSWLSELEKMGTKIEVVDSSAPEFGTIEPGRGFLKTLDKSTEN